VADKHTLALELLREYGVDLSIPREVEFTIISLSPIDERSVREFASLHGFEQTVEKIDDLYMGTLTKRLLISEQNVRPLSKSVEQFAKKNGWDYEGWGASSYK
jgi:Regulator of ribonuclease activity B